MLDKYKLSKAKLKYLIMLKIGMIKAGNDNPELKKELADLLKQLKL